MRSIPNEGRRENFEKEMLPHMTAVYNFAVRMIGDSDDAKDLVQETYIRAYRYFEKFALGTNARGWLVQIMKNIYINQYRKNIAAPEKVEYDEIENFYANIKSSMVDGNDLQEKLFGNLLDDEVSGALLELPDEFRMAVVLFDIEGFTYAEIAEINEVPVGTVRSRLHRGRKILRDKLREYALRHGFKHADEKVDED
ncbi:MAG: sigma-70 family RNA polymerase sigma factor [Candidatus Kryptoniota bacterium]